MKKFIINNNEIPKSLIQKIFGVEPKVKGKIANRDIICYKPMIPIDIPGVIKSSNDGNLSILGYYKKRLLNLISYGDYIKIVLSSAGYSKNMFQIALDALLSN